MVYVTKCEYNIDIGRLEMEDLLGNQYWIDVYAVEDECADNMMNGLLWIILCIMNRLNMSTCCLKVN